MPALGAAGLSAGSAAVRCPCPNAGELTHAWNDSSSAQRVMTSHVVRSSVGLSSSKPSKPGWSSTAPARAANRRASSSPPSAGTVIALTLMIVIRVFFLRYGWSGIRQTEVRQARSGGQNRIVGVALGATGVEGLHVGLVELGAGAQPLDKVRVGQEPAADTEEIGGAGVDGLLRSGKVRAPGEAGVEHDRAVPLLP